MMQGSAEAAHQTHTLGVGGSSPSPATTTLFTTMHEGAAQYWGSVAAFHLFMCLERYTDVRAAKAIVMAELAARHALMLLGRDDGSEAGSVSRRRL